MESEKFKDLEDRLGQVEEILTNMDKKLSKIDMGLFGDASINYVGVIDKQKQLEEKLNLLNREIEEIKKKNTEQDISIGAKKSLKETVWSIGRSVAQMLINLLMFYLIYKGIIGPDAMIK